MKQSYSLLLQTIFLLLPGLIHADRKDEFFKIKKQNQSIARQVIGKEIRSTAAFSPFSASNEKPNLAGLAISGTIEKENDDYFVRIILKDKKGGEHLVFESYDEINDSPIFSFTDYCEETAMLDGIEPDSIKVICRFAKVRLQDISYATENNSSARTSPSMDDDYAMMRKEQQQTKVDKINNYNREHKKLWRAGVTSLSEKSYEVRKRVMGLTDESNTGGLEYYIGGIFEMGTKQSDSNVARTRQMDRTSPSFVDHFDWRNRHGKNWMTPVKNQHDANFCMPFAIVASIEAKVNLYYNRKIDLNLSEQQIGTCAVDSDTYISGIAQISDAMPYVVNHGIYDEDAYPFVNDSNQICLSNSITPNEHIRFDSYSQLFWFYPDDIKNRLIHDGPMPSGYSTLSGYDYGSHAMCLVGYGIVHLGDIIRFYLGSPELSYLITVEDGNPLIGQTYWIFKNSWGGLGEQVHDGYMYIVFNHPVLMLAPCSFNLPMYDMVRSDSYILCEDADGDGYYYWGIDSIKPSTCPEWVPDTPDGDDSNICLGIMDYYGNLDVLPDGVTIKTNISYAADSTITQRIGIVNGGTLTISGNSTLSGYAKIRVCEGGVLIVDGGSISDADLDLVPTSTLILRNGGTINMASGKSFHAPVGAIVQIESGEINPYGGT